MNRLVKDFIEHLGDPSTRHWHYVEQKLPEINHVDFSTKKREALAEKGQAMPHGGYPIRNVADLKRAIQAFGRARNKAATKAWIIRRARALGVTDLLPDGWLETKQSNLIVADFINHHGVKGMRWGVRRSQDQLRRSSGRTVYGKSPSKLTEDELNRRIRRMESEKRYNELNKRDVSQGEKIAKEILTNVGKQVVTNVATTALTGLGAYALKKQLGKSAKLPDEVVNRMTGFGRKKK